MKHPQRVFSTKRTWTGHIAVKAQWTSHILEHNAVVLKNGENPSDYPNEAVAFETLNFGWILSVPDHNGHRSVLVKF